MAVAELACARAGFAAGRFLAFARRGRAANAGREHRAGGHTPQAKLARPRHAEPLFGVARVLTDAAVAVEHPRVLARRARQRRALRVQGARVAVRQNLCAGALVAVGVLFPVARRRSMLRRATGSVSHCRHSSRHSGREFRFTAPPKVAAARGRATQQLTEFFRHTVSEQQIERVLADTAEIAGSVRGGGRRNRAFVAVRFGTHARAASAARGFADAHVCGCSCSGCGWWCCGGPRRGRKRTRGARHCRRRRRHGRRCT